MFMSIKSKVIALLMTLILALSVTSLSFAQSEQIPELANGEELVDEVVEEIIEGGDFTTEEELEIADDVEAISEIGLDIGTIENVDASSGELVIAMEVTDEITDEITIDVSDDAIIMEVSEGDKHDTVVFMDEGAIFLDGKQVTVETETSIGPNANLVTSETGGVKWYSTSSAPSYLKKAKYKSYSKYPDWTCASVNFHKAISAISYSTAVGILAGVKGGFAGMAISGAIGFFSSTLYELVNYDRKSQCISFKYYIVRGKSNSRYLKLRRYTWARKNYKPSGKYVTTYEYGLVV